MNVTMIESKFALYLDHDQIGRIIDALIDKADAETYDGYAKQLLKLAAELQKGFEAALHERSRPYSAMQIQKRLEALEAEED